jgi:tetratricopeptide (TPR) repeat protein
MEDKDRSGGVNISGEHVEVEGDVVGRDKIVTDSRTQAIGKNIVQIGTLVIPTVPVVAVLALLGLVVIVVGVSLSGSAGGPRPAETPGPTRMRGGFNVIVAEFGQVGADGKLQPSEIGQQVSLQVFNALVAQKDQFTDAIVKSSMEIWHAAPPITGGLVVDEAAAAQLAERVNASMVIYGNLDSQNGLTPQFYVSPQVRGDIDSLVTGHHALGDKPIRVDPAAPLDGNVALATRTSALLYLSMGLTYNLIGNPEQALEVYRQAQTQLKSWNEKGEGKEVLYFFAGQAALYWQQKTSGPEAADLDQEAQTAFEKALFSNSSYARAEVGLGDVYFLRAQRQQPPQLILETPDLKNAFDHYQNALKLAGQSSDAQAGILARISLGTAYYLWGGAYWHNNQYAEAHDSLDAAIKTIETTLAPLNEMNQYRLLGQAYLAQGAAYTMQARIWAEQNDQSQSVTFFEQARQAYQKCIDQGARAPGDKILTELVIGDKCKPNYDKAAAGAQGTPEGGP